jgi:hypothetical protein
MALEIADHRFSGKPAGPCDNICDQLLRVGSSSYAPETDPQLIPSIVERGSLPPDFCTTEKLSESIQNVQSDLRPIDVKMTRVYLEGVLNGSARNSLLATPIQTGESFLAWLQRSLKSDSFGVVINGFERWSESTALSALNLFQPLIEAWGLPTTAIELTLFAGNYGYTPFGIHLDDPYTYTVHFQLGPGAKTMSLWTREQFRELIPAADASSDYSRLMPHASHTVVNAGDIYLLPPHYYHVGYTPDLSIGIAVCISRLPSMVLAQKALEIACLSKELRIFTEDLIAERPGTNLAKDISLKEWLTASVSDFLNLEHSKGGLKNAFRRRSSRPAAAILFLDRKFDLIIREQQLSSHVIYARGNRLQLPATTDSRFVLDVLQNEHCVNQEIVSCKDDAARGLVDALYAYGILSHRK